MNASDKCCVVAMQPDEKLVGEHINGQTTFKR